MATKYVLTFEGRKALRENCRKIQSEYYEIDRDCFKMFDGKWHRKNNGLIEKDAITGEYHFKKDMILGIIGFVENEALKGFFIEDLYNNVEVLYGDNFIVCATREIAEKAGYKEALAIGKYVKPDKNNKVLFTGVCSNAQRYYKIDIPYSLSDYSAKVKRDFQEAYDNYNPTINDFVDKFGDAIRHSFGVELETTEGILPWNLCKAMGVLPVLDGSLRKQTLQGTEEGLEYVTIPLEGKKGVQTLINISKELAKRTLFDYKCSLHIHFGNVDTSELGLVATYMLLYQIQDEVFEILPMYKKVRANDDRRNRHYCKQLSSLKMFMNKLTTEEGLPNNEAINQAYQDLYRFLSCGYFYDADYINSGNHPYGNRKWNIRSRYYWVNLVPTLFNKVPTIEFRAHQMTNNPIKVINWLFICNAILEYAEKNKLSIIKKEAKISIEDILTVYLNYENGQELYNYLLDYYRDRRGYYIDRLIGGDEEGIETIEEDRRYASAAYKNLWSKDLENISKEIPQRVRMREIQRALANNENQDPVVDNFRYVVRDLEEQQNVEF